MKVEILKLPFGRSHCTTHRGIKRTVSMAQIARRALVETREDSINRKNPPLFRRLPKLRTVYATCENGIVHFSSGFVFPVAQPFTAGFAFPCRI